MKRRTSAAIIAVLMSLLLLPQTVFAAPQLQDRLDSTAAYTVKQIRDPQPGSEWSIIALAGSRADLPGAYMSRYYQNTEKMTAEKQGVLSTSRYTEYARTVLGITASGHDASKVGSYDLTAPLSDVEKVKKQGVNGPVFALIALDSAAYPSEARQDYVDYLLDRQLKDGGWAYSGEDADPDMTAMTLQALSGYTDDEQTAEAVQEGVDCLAALLGEDGLYETYGDKSSESLSQVIIAMTAVGVDLDDPRFVKNDKNLLEQLYLYQLPDGSFCHIKGGPTDGLATAQAFLAMASVRKAEAGQPYIYIFGNDYIHQQNFDFTDTFGHWAAADIEKACRAGLFSGTTKTTFSPETPLSRAMLVTVLWRMTGEPAPIPEIGGGTERLRMIPVYTDVDPNSYYANAVAWASENGIVSGYGNGLFGPDDVITREQMAAIMYRYAGYRGNDVSQRADISRYADEPKIASWAKDAMSWANAAGLINGTGPVTIDPAGSATRAQTAAIMVRYQGKFN